MFGFVIFNGSVTACFIAVLDSVFQHGRILESDWSDGAHYFRVTAQLGK